ncbi:adenylyl-sulfate kinase [Pseudomonas triticifolii]|uniref:Adenylyl-sulfate kinase n=1 Tax=Pseudomonas triticifolii TaxID=2762592 RepID=A0ABR7B931_9PSED|nr:adenylyl-sulfate kinase [Pseudomonas triticifolii]MBC3953676.1 adenylyl-sulfate kinase [Pseudomonas triticifolii]
MQNRLIEAAPVIWLTGLSGAGKSTIAMQLKSKLDEQGIAVVILDGDELRAGLCSDLGFSDEDRTENIRRVIEVARLFRDTGVCVVVALISPFARDRAAAREALNEGFFEVFVDTPLAICEARDPKGLYAKVRRGDIKQFTGLSSPYEVPLAPDVHLDGAMGCKVDEHVDVILKVLKGRGGKGFTLRR